MSLKHNPSKANVTLWTSPSGPPKRQWPYTLKECHNKIVFFYWEMEAERCVKSKVAFAVVSGRNVYIFVLHTGPKYMCLGMIVCTCVCLQNNHTGWTSPAFQMESKLSALSWHQTSHHPRPIIPIKMSAPLAGLKWNQLNKTKEPIHKWCINLEGERSFSNFLSCCNKLYWVIIIINILWLEK